MRTTVFLMILFGCGGVNDGGMDGSYKPDTGTGDGGSPGMDSGNDGRMEGGPDAVYDIPDNQIPGDAGSGVYSAYFVSGGLDRVHVYKADANRSLCFEVRLVSPSNQTGGLMLPAMWGLEQAGVWNDHLACDPSYAGSATFTPTNSQSGSVSWQGVTPQALDIDVNLGLVMPELLKATNIQVQ